MSASTPKFGTDKFVGKTNSVIWRREINVLFKHTLALAILGPNKYHESWKGELLAEKFGDAHSVGIRRKKK